MTQPTLTRYVALSMGLPLVLVLSGCPSGSGSSTFPGGDDATASDGYGSSISDSGDSTGDLPSTSGGGVPVTSGTESTSTTGDTTMTSTDDSTTLATTGDTGSTSAQSSSSTTSDPSSFCGDGIQDVDEECDDGEENGVGGTCNADCTLQSCGDGYFDADVEQCDGSDPDFVETALCTDACTWGGVIVFVTDETFQGDLGGLTGAHQLCKTAAKDAGLTKPDGYRAWLSVSPENAASQIPLVDKPYYRLDGEVIAATKDDLLDGKLLFPLVVTELKSTLPMASPVWTNSNADGSVKSPTDDCQSFSSASPDDSGQIGLSGKTDASWTSLGASSCDQFRRLYCFSDAF